MCYGGTLYVVAIAALSSAFADRLYLARFTLKLALGKRTVGVWGGHLDPTNGGDDGIWDNPYEHAYLVRNYSNIKVDRLSCDRSTNRLYLSVYHPNKARDIFEMSLCSKAQQQENFLFRNVRIVEHNLRHLMHTRCLWKCKWGPLYVHEGKMYFIMSHVVGPRSNPQRHVQLRRLEGCEESFREAANRTDSHVIYDVDILKCSRLLFILHSDSTTTAHRHWPKVWPSSGLKVTRLEDGTLAAFVLLVNSTNNVSMTMIRVTLDNNNNNNSMAETVLHSVPIEHPYSELLLTNRDAHAAIDYHKGVLCYLVGDQLICGVYKHPKDNFQPVKLLKTGEAIEAGICNPGDSIILKTQLTGLAIAETRDLLSVFFSCRSYVLGQGEIGVVRLSHHGLRKQLISVIDRQGLPVVGDQLVSTPSAEQLNVCNPPLKKEKEKKKEKEYHHVSHVVNQTITSSSVHMHVSVATLVVVVAAIAHINDLHEGL